VFVLGEDLTQTAARMALALRQSVKGKAEDMAEAMRVQPWLDAAVKNIGQHALNPLFIASLAETKLDDIAEECVHAAPDDLARIGFAVAHASTPAPRPSKAWTPKPWNWPSASPTPCSRPSVR
jgi:NADH-quinone oxidoreductase subunit G